MREGLLEHVWQRFVVPPFVLASLIFFAVITDPNLGVYKRLVELVKDASLVSALPAGVAFLGATAGVFSAGFVLAMTSAFILRCISYFRMRPRFRSWNLSMRWDEKSEEILKNRDKFEFEDFYKEAEHVEQAFIGQRASPHVLNWMRRRWEYFIINSNCSWACLVAMVVVCFLPVDPKLYWYIAPGFLAIVFGFIAYHSWHEAVGMSRFLVRNPEAWDKKQPESDRESQGNINQRPPTQTMTRLPGSD